MTETAVVYNAVRFTVAAPAPQPRAFTDAEIRTAAGKWFAFCYAVGLPWSADECALADEVCAGRALRSEIDRGTLAYDERCLGF